MKSVATSISNFMSRDASYHENNMIMALIVFLDAVGPVCDKVQDMKPDILKLFCIIETFAFVHLHM